MADFRFLDKRVQRTKIDFFHALFELLQKKSFAKISITDIIAQAGYSRGTFYAHYSQKDDLLNDIIHYLFKEMIDAYRGTYINEESINIQELVDEPLNFLHHFKQHGRYYQLLLGSNVQIDFSNLLTTQIINLYLEDFEILERLNGQKVDSNLFNRYCAYGLAGLILEWIKDDFPVEPEDFSEKLVKLFQYSMDSVQVKNKRSPKLQ